MTYTRRYPKRYKKRPYTRRKSTQYSKLSRQIQQLKKVSTEFKYKDFHQVPLNLTSTAHFILLNGLDSTERDGLVYNLKRNTIRGTLTLPDGVSDDTTTVIRLTLIKVKNTGGVDPTAAQVFTDTTHPYNSFFNLNNVGKQGNGNIKVLYDKRYRLSQLFADSENSRYFSINTNLNTQVRCAGTTGAIGSIASNAFYLIASSNSFAVTHPSMEYNRRLTYLDN